jgi:hypothetical protein
MSTAHENVRRGLMLDSLGRPADLNAVDWHVRQQYPSASPSEVQSETLEVIRSLVIEGLFRLGGMREEKGHSPQRFVPWGHPLDHSIHKITHVYIKHYDDPEKWMYSAWLKLTEKGEQLARSIETTDIEGYRRRT